MNGIGGNTIAQAVRNISDDELNIWIKYINKRGTLNNGRRIEVGLGHLQYYYLTGKGVKNLKIKNFTPHEFTENEKPKNNIKTVEDFKRAFGG